MVNRQDTPLLIRPAARRGSKLILAAGSFGLWEQSSGDLSRDNRRETDVRIEGRPEPPIVARRGTHV